MSKGGHIASQGLKQFVSHAMEARLLCTPLDGLRHRGIFSSMYEFTRLEGEPEPKASGDRFGPPRKHTTAACWTHLSFLPFVQNALGVTSR